SQPFVVAVFATYLTPKGPLPRFVGGRAGRVDRRGPMLTGVPRKGAAEVGLHTPRVWCRVVEADPQVARSLIDRHGWVEPVGTGLPVEPVDPPGRARHRREIGI